MGERDFGVMLVPIVALLALFVPAAGAPVRPAGEPTAEAREAPAAVAQQRPRTAEALLNEFTSLSAATDASGAPKVQAGECLIATFPDPIDAGNLNYTYDRYLDALQRGLEAAGYVLDRYDLPWIDKRSADPAQEPRYRMEPARLLFRRGTEAALVFVVGETPTAGIHKAAFVQAVSELTKTCASTDPINVLGPSFSGSQKSLTDLVGYFRPTARFTIVSGSATAIDPASITVGAAEGTTFRTTVVADAEARRQFFRVIAEREEWRTFERIRHLFRKMRLLRTEHRVKVALLTESNTGFGQVSAASTPTTTPVKDLFSLEVIRLPFPLHIASLRVASGEGDGAQRESGEKSHGVARLTRLDLRDPAPSTAVMPLLSRIENPSMEIVLNSLLKKLEEEHVRYIGLVATDVRDRIFLTQQIRHHLPNSSVFMFSGDLLYVHPDVNVDLRGVEVITSYPLYSPNQLWSPAAGGPRPRLLFPTHTTQGVYNATLALLGLEDHMQEYTYPFRPGTPPAIWLSIVGSEALQPVQLLGHVDNAEGRMVAMSYSTTGSVPLPDHPWLPTIALLLCVIPAAYVFFNLDSTKRFADKAPFLQSQFATGRLARLFSDTVFGMHTLPRHLYRFACWSALSSAYVLTMATFIVPQMASAAFGEDNAIELESGLLSPLFLAVMVVGFAIMLATAAILGAGVWKKGDAEDTRARWLRHVARVGLGIGSLVLLAFSIGVGLHWLQVAKRSPAEGVLLYIRSSDFDSGVSPLLPLVLVSSAAVAWSVSSLRRLRLLEGPDQYAYDADGEPKRPNSFLGLEGPSFEGIVCLEGEVLNAIGRRSTALPWPVLSGVLALLLVAWIRLFGPRAVPTAEGAVFDALFALGFLTVYTGLALSFLRFVFIWRKLLRLLQRLAWHPTVKAYARLGEKIPGKPRINLTSPSQILTALEFSVDRAGQLAALGRDLVKSGKAERRFTLRLSASLPELENHVQAAEGALHRALEAEVRGNWRALVRERTAAEQSLALMATRVSDLVRPAWRLPATDAPVKGKEEPTEIQWFELAEDFLTSRVAAFLSHVVPQLQNLIVFVTMGLLLMLLAVTSYPFQPRQLLLMFNTLVIIGVVATTFVVFVQMERETILSVLSDTTPGKINFNRDFVSRIAIYVVLPLISLLGAQFPEVTQQLVTWTSSFFGTH